MVPPSDRRTPPERPGCRRCRGRRGPRGEPVELGDPQGVVGAHGREGLVQDGPGAVSAGESLVEVDPVSGDAETGEDLVWV